MTVSVKTYTVAQPCTLRKIKNVIYLKLYMLQEMYARYRASDQGKKSQIN